MKEVDGQQGGGGRVERAGKVSNNLAYVVLDAVVTPALRRIQSSHSTELTAAREADDAIVAQYSDQGLRCARAFHFIKSTQRLTNEHTSLACVARRREKNAHQGSLVTASMPMPPHFC